MKSIYTHNELPQIKQIDCTMLIRLTPKATIYSQASLAKWLIIKCRFQIFRFLVRSLWIIERVSTRIRVLAVD